MAELQNISEYCLKCKSQTPRKFRDGEIDLETARKNCAYCKFGKVGIYKFDIVYHLFVTTEKQNKKNLPTGKKETYSKRYGAAIKNLLDEGKTVREIAKILGISPVSVVKVKKILNAPASDDKEIPKDELENQLHIED